MLKKFESNLNQVKTIFFSIFPQIFKISSTKAFITPRLRIVLEFKKRKDKKITKRK